MLRRKPAGMQCENTMIGNTVMTSIEVPIPVAPNPLLTHSTMMLHLQALDSVTAKVQAGQVGSQEMHVDDNVA